ncbi:ComEC/Rec2 family competence protein [Helicobacter mesocricetorum]|uniref:ComEC/Rec2 family competence protein n=1 Tax=Helicobacter mesocricetorum TaxID=87012 RepID=UPI000CF0D77D|nr:ComEC/Rec2 family competence protein [Helicobacter mesocricetorum]
MKNLSPPLFINAKERIVFALFLSGLLILSLAFKYHQFHTLKSQKTPLIYANVLSQYTKTKNSKSYFVLKLQTKFGIFYTTSREDLKDLKYKNISLRVVFSQVSFLDFLKGFYAGSFNLTLLQGEDFRKPIRDFIAKQHIYPLMSEYYLSLFLSDPLPLAWRELSQSYGISHLFAISGYHIGILSFVGFMVLSLLYKPLQKHYFPYRNYYFDIGILVLTLLILYYLFLTQSPSYLRALAMSCVGFFLTFRGLDFLKLESFFWSIALLVALFPSLIFSLGFYFSCMGVLYIFLFFKYFKIPKKLWHKFLYIALLNASTFLLMGVIIYYFFPLFSPLSLLSLLLTPLFSLYYPCMLLAHFFGFGGILDPLLLKWLNLHIPTITLTPNLYLFILCNALTLFAIFYRLGFFILLFTNISYYLYGVYHYFAIN